MLNDNTAVTASISNNADITNANAVVVSADNTTTLTALSAGANISLGLAGGASVARGSMNGSATATIGNNVEIGRVLGKNVNSVIVSANTTVNATADAYAIAAGFVGIGGNNSEWSLTPHTTASIGSSTFIKTNGNLQVLATGTTNATVNTFGISAGAFAVALSFANADVRPVVSTSVGVSSQLDAGGSVIVKANHVGGTAKANGTGSVGGLVAGGGNVMTATMRPTATSSIGNSAHLTGGGDVRVTAIANGTVKSDATNLQLGLVAGGHAEANANELGTSSATLGTNVIVSAGFAFELSAKTIGRGNSTAKGGGIAGVDISRAFATTKVDYNSSATVGNGTHINAGTTLAVGTNNNSVSQAFAQLRTGGVGTDAFTNARSLIGTEQSTISTDIGENVLLTAKTIQLFANVDQMYSESDASSNSISGISDTDSEATATANSAAKLRVRTGAVLDGEDAVELKSNQFNVTANADAYTYFGGLGGDSDPTTFANFSIVSEIFVDSGSTVTTSDLLVESRVEPPTFVSNAHGDSYAIDFGTNDPHSSRFIKRDMQYNATTNTIRSKTPVLQVAADGSITKAVNVDFEVTPNEVIVNGITSGGGVRFEMPQFPASSVSDILTTSLTGTATFNFEKRVRSVTIDNASAKDLHIRGINTETDLRPNVSINVHGLVATNFSSSVSNGPIVSVPVTINSTQTDVILDGIILNPVGFVDITTGQDIVSQTSDARIKTPSVTLSAMQSVGTTSAPIRTEVTRLNGFTQSGGFFVTDTDGLIIGGVSSTLDLNGISVGGAIGVVANGALTVSQDVVAIGNVTLTTIDTAGAGQDVNVLSQILVASRSNNLTINAGDNLTVATRGGVFANNDLIINADAGNADVGTGATITIDGSLVSQVLGHVTINGHTDTDSLIVTGLVGDVTSNTWNITALNAGDINGNNRFTAIENLTGGAFADTFHFTDAIGVPPSISGFVDGAGGRDSLDYSAYGVGRAATVNRQTAQATSVGSFRNMEHFTGGQSVNDLLIGRNLAATWTVTTDNTGFVNTTEFDFDGVENLTGGILNDLFVMRVGAALGGTITGSSATTPADSDRIDLSAYLSTAIFTGEGINRGFIGDGTRTITKFDSVENLKGGAGNDEFRFLQSAGITGLIEGNGGSHNLLDYSAWTTNMAVNLATGTNPTGTQTGIQHVLGGAGNDTLTGNTAENRLVGGLGNDSITGGGGRDLLVGDNHGGFFLSVTFLLNITSSGDGADTLIGGSSDDVILGGGGRDVINAGDGNNIVLGDTGTVAYVGNFVGSVTSTGSVATDHDTITTGSGNDWVIAGDGSDVVTDNGGLNVVIGDRGTFFFTTGLLTRAETQAGSSTSGNDTLTLGNNDDIVMGGAGSDLITTNQGVDLIFGDGARLIFASSGLSSFEVLVSSTDGGDSIEAGDGDDTVYAGDGNNTVRGNNGNDDIFAGAGADLLEGQADDDFIFAGLGNDSVTGGLGNDVLGGGLAFATRLTYVVNVNSSRDGDAGDGQDSIFGEDGNDSIYGGADTDSLSGGIGTDFVDAGAGNDVNVSGGDGNDTVRGGAGNDVLHGDNGIDLVFGDGGDDKLFGDAGNGNSQAGQSLFGGDGRDELFAYATSTTTVGDQLFGEADGDSLYGNLGADFLVGGTGNDFIQGDGLNGPGYAKNVLAATTGGNDTIFGDSGEDQIYGGGGNDLIWGGADSDLIQGQAGANTVFGGGGIDIFTLWTGTGAGNDKFDGHGGNSVLGDVEDDNATDILMIDGTSGDDVILLSQHKPANVPVGGGNVRLDYKAGSAALVTRSLDFLKSDGTPLVEQFQIAGFAGNDVLGFATADAILPNTVTNPVGSGSTQADPLNLSLLNDRSNDWVGAFQGNSGNDLLLGGNGRDWMDGGLGSDVLYGFAGDDRLWGDNGDGSTADTDVLFGGAGNDDAIGGLGKNYLYSWSIAPDSRLVPTPGANFSAGNVQAVIDGGAVALANFGVFVDPNGKLFTADSGGGAYKQEVTGLNRMLGGEQGDFLFGGTTVDFMFGNGGQDVLFRANGSTMESMDDGGLGGDDWKQYAREQDAVWYVGGTNADDEIHVDFVTEPGVLADHHLVTRLTNNNGNFSFAAQVKLDFNATDARGKPIWNPNDLVKLNEFRVLDQAGIPRDVDSLLTQLNVTEAVLASYLLPPEGDFQVILIDALAGNDTVIVGPTVQKTVWIDAGAGDDRVEIQGGNAILVDQAETGRSSRTLRTRNDSIGQSYGLAQANDSGILLNRQFNGLTIDNPNDVDWFSFSLLAHEGIANLTMTTASPADTVTIDLFLQTSVSDPNAVPLLTATGTQTATMDLNSLAINRVYAIRVKTNLTPTIYGLKFDYGPSHTLTQVNLSSAKTTLVRRDVILGGTGNDILSGGSGEDWIFGQAGNDVLSGGKDRNASDLLFGGSGNDTFQIIPDALPLLANQPNTVFDPATKTFIPTYSDLYVGGSGEDRVLFLGGDLDRLGREVPDYAAVRFNTVLQRYALLIDESIG